MFIDDPSRSSPDYASVQFFASLFFRHADAASSIESWAGRSPRLQPAAVRSLAHLQCGRSSKYCTMNTYKFAPLTILKSAHTKIKNFKSIRISTCKKRGGRGQHSFAGRLWPMSWKNHSEPPATTAPLHVLEMFEHSRSRGLTPANRATMLELLRIPNVPRSTRRPPCGEK
jgi:hypothetical protein